MSYEESVAYMSGLLQFGMRLDRERFTALLARLGDPHKRLRCVHVAGTNGKGSTTTFVSSVLRAAGYRVGTYLSPYVFDLRERIQVGGEMIPPADFARWVTVIRPHIEAVARDPDLGQTTEFELKTAVAFCYFAERGVDFAAVEVGIGGRLDATNVIPPPLVAVITHIGLDHTSILGDTLAQIAAEKAGIIKKGTAACVTAVPPGEALDVIAAAAERQGVPLLRVGPAAAVPPDPDRFGVYRIAPDRDGGVDLEIGGEGDADRVALEGLRLRLRGDFQAANAAAAAAAVEVLRRRGVVTISPERFRAGLESASLPGRFQVVREGRDGDRPALVLDGAHNEDGARVLAGALEGMFPGRRCVLVAGMRHNHEPEPFLRVLAPLSRRVVATAPPFKPRPAAEVAAAAGRLGVPAEVAEPAADAVLRALETASADEVVVVTGSFYTVGEVPPFLRGAWS
jgi:dihydrofolate synthase/folylpolyglutamate synthase